MRHPYRALSVSVVIVGTLLCGSQREAAADDETDRATLRGLAGVGVVVEPLGKEIERDGLTAAQIQTDVELRLRRSGIHVLSIAENRNAPGMPFLSVRVNVLKQKDIPLYAFSIYVTLMQDVLLARDSKISSHAATWDTDSVGTVGEAHLRDVRNSVGDYVDRFINAYLAVNPKQ